MAGFFGGTERVSLLTKPQRNVLNQMSNLLLNNIGVGGPVYSGPTVAGASPLQQQAFQAGGGLLSRMPDTSGALSSLLAGSDPNAIQNYYQSAVVDPARRQFQDTLSQVGQRYGDTFGQSGGLSRALGQATSDFGLGLSGQLAQLQENERQAGFGRQLQGIGAASQDQANYMNTLNQMMGLGGAQRGIQTQQNMDQLSRWQQAQPWNNPWLQALSGPVLNTQAFGYATDPGMASGIGSMLGGLGMMGAGFMGP